MKYVILVGDGMGDYPMAELGGKTPLEAAKTPIDGRLARQASWVRPHHPAGKEPGSDIANLAIMGYDPAHYHTGRAPLEAAALGVDLAPQEVAFRCNLVTLRHEDSGLIMEDYAAGHITSEEAREIIQVLDSALGQEGRRFYPGVSYRHLLVWTEGDAAWRTYPPHDRTGQEVGHLIGHGRGRTSVGPDAGLLAHLEGLRHQPPAFGPGERPANSIWLWGRGGRRQMPTLKERFGLTGAVIWAVDLIRGIGKYAGLKPILVPGATGFLDTNYGGKVAAALAALKDMDLVFVHVEAPDEAGHSGELSSSSRPSRTSTPKWWGPCGRAWTSSGITASWCSATT